ncbi:MAG: hypothetical protein ACK559_16470, partial [bacterium]
MRPVFTSSRAGPAKGAGRIGPEGTSPSLPSSSRVDQDADRRVSSRRAGSSPPSGERAAIRARGRRSRARGRGGCARDRADREADRSAGRCSA